MPLELLPDLLIQPYGMHCAIFTLETENNMKTQQRNQSVLELGTLGNWQRKMAAGDFGSCYGELATSTCTVSVTTNGQRMSAT